MSIKQNYLITFNNDIDVYEQIEKLKKSISFNNRTIEGLAINFNDKYQKKNRNISTDEYTNYKLNKHVDKNLKMCYTKDLTKSILDDLKYQVNIDLTEVEKVILENKNFIKSIKETNHLQLLNVENNSKTNFLEFNPKNNFSLISQNYVHQNDTIQNTGNNQSQKLFNASKLDNNNPLPYNQLTSEYDIPIDIIIIDNGVWWKHNNLIRNDGTRICQYTLEQQKKSLWRLSNIYDILGINYIKNNNVPEGVDTTSSNFFSYYEPTKKEINLGYYNHGTFNAGIIAGTETGWLRNKSVRIYSIPLVNMFNKFVSGVNEAIENIIEILILEFQINKIIKSDFSPTLICRNYEKTGWFNNKDLFSNFTQNQFTKLYKMKATLGINISLFNSTGVIFDSESYLLLGALYKLQKKMGAISFYAAGNSTELQLVYSDNSSDFYNRYYVQQNQYVVYPYRPYYTTLNSKYYTILGSNIDNINLSYIINYISTYSFTTGNRLTFTINYNLLSELVNRTLYPLTYQNSFLIMDPDQSCYLIGSSGLRQMGISDTLKSLTEQNNIWFQNYLPTGYTSFGSAVYNSQGSIIFSSSAYDTDTKELNPNYYNIGSGSSSANSNCIGIIGIFLQWITHKGYIGKNKNNATITQMYIKNYLETYCINLNTLLFKLTFPFSETVTSNLESLYLDLKNNNNKSSYTDFYPFQSVNSILYSQPVPYVPFKIIYQADLTNYIDRFQFISLDKNSLLENINILLNDRLINNNLFKYQIDEVKNILNNYNSNLSSIILDLSNNNEFTDKTKKLLTEYNNKLSLLLNNMNNNQNENTINIYRILQNIISIP